MSSRLMIICWFTCGVLIRLRWYSMYLFIWINLYISDPSRAFFFMRWNSNSIYGLRGCLCSCSIFTCKHKNLKIKIYTFHMILFLMECWNVNAHFNILTNYFMVITYILGGRWMARLFFLHNLFLVSIDEYILKPVETGNTLVCDWYI